MGYSLPPACAVRHRNGGCLFGRKKIIHCRVQLYSLTFRNRKSDKRFSRLKRRRESVATWRILPETQLFSPLLSLQAPTALLLRYVRVAYGKIAARQARGYGVLYEVIPGSAKVLFFIFSNSQQDSAFPPSSLARDDFAEFLFFVCVVQRVPFPKLPTVHDVHSLLRHLHTSEFRSPSVRLRTAQAGGREYPTAFFLFKGYRFLCSFLFKKKARILRSLRVPPIVSRETFTSFRGDNHRGFEQSR